MIILPVGIQLKPPLLQTYILPSGPSAAPLGPPGISATTSLRPSGQTRVSRRPRISTSTTDPSGMTTGPSGNSRPVAITRIFPMKSSRLDLAAGGFRRSIPHAQHIVAPVMTKEITLAKQPRATPPRRAALRCGPLRQSASVADRDPDFQPAIAGAGIELFVVAFEVRRVGGFHPRCRQPVIPDRVDGAANGRDVLAMG